MSLPDIVIRALAAKCGCSVDDVERTLAHLGEEDAAASSVNRAIDQERIDIIRAWLRTPDADRLLSRG